MFGSTLASFNSGSDSATLHRYNESDREAATFYEDLLELRTSLAYLDEQAAIAYRRILRPIKPKTLHNDDEEIVISLVHKEAISFDQKLKSLLSSSLAPDSQALARAFLLQSDKGAMHGVFAGRKFRSMGDKDLADHYDKYFDQLTTSLRDAGTLKTTIEVNGKAIDDMSPGMKAQALLKLFLNDEIASGKWKYVVLDQPEDNLDVATIKSFLIDRLKALKLDVQFFVVSHSAPVIVNGDARTVVVCENDDKGIRYRHGTLIDQSIKQEIADVLDGGERYLKMRLNKYNFQVGDAR